MKKTLLLLASTAMLLVGCAKEKFSPEAGDAEMVNMTVSALVQGEELTRAAVDEDGKGVNANRCIMVLYYGDQVYGRYTATVSNYKATFDVKVPAKRTYKAVFWADCAAEDGGDLYYDTADLTNITLKSDYVGNDDKRDAFFKCEEYTVENKSQSFTATLTRPFAQINVISKDIKDLHLAALYPQKVNLSFSAATSFNAMSGECGAAEAIAYEADVYKEYDSTKEQLTLSMDYLFAGDRSTVDIDFKAPTEGELKVEHNFSNIPYQRNYRTNIVGNLLTADAHWDVTINPKWNEPAEEVKFVEAGSVAAANEAFANGATSVKITSVGEETTLYLPQTKEEVTIDFANPLEVVTVNYGPDPTKAAGDKPAAVNIATNDVTKFVVSGISNIVWLAGNQAALANALTNATNKQVVALSNDITMSGEWTPVTTKNSGGYYIGTFDGKNHVISDLQITDYPGTYAGFFSTMSGATIKNVTFKNATVTNAVSNEGARGAVIAGWSYAGVIDNCHVINSSVTGGQKVAGILGCISVEGAASKNEVTNCSVEGLTLSSNIPNDILYQAGALVGYMQLVAANPNGILIENNTVKDITINDAFAGPDNQAWYSGTFIGSIIRKQKVDGQKIVLNNNTISGTNTELYKSMYSSEYFGWATNTENYTGAIAPIVIDGQEWNPAFYMDAEGKYHVTNLEALKYFRDMVNGDKSFEGKTVLLDADIDMAGEAWTPIGNVTSYPSISFDGIFDGQNHTIDNLSCTDNTQNYACAALFGSLMGTVQNLKLTNVNINSTHYAAAIAAYSSSSESKITNCSVIGGTITSTPEWLESEYDNGDKAGAIIGYNGEGGTIDNCYVEGVTVTAYRDLGAIAGAGGVSKTTNNKANNCTLIVDRTNFYGDKDVNAAPIVGRNLGGTLNTNNTAENVTVALSANTADAIRAAVNAFNATTTAGAYTITIANGTYEVSDLLIRKNVSGKSLLMKAANPKGATLKVKAGGDSPYIFKFDGCASYDETRTTSFEGINFDLSAIPASETAVAQLMSQPNWYGYGIFFDGCDLTGGNSMNEKALYVVSSNKCSARNVVVKNCSIANVGYLASCYVEGFVAENVTTTTSVKHFINNQTSGITVKNCYVDCYTDYAVRTNGGPVSITGSTFVMTYTGTENGGVFVNRRPDTQLTMTGNTYPASYAGTNMHDIYNDPDDGKGGDCILNGSITINVGGSYDFPRE